jgi:hypothetical protein
MHDDDTKIGNILPFVAKRRTTELRILLTADELAILNKAAKENTAAWARRVLLAAAAEVR